jgi:hypothetical protein
MEIEQRALPRILVQAVVLGSLCLIPDLGWWLGLAWIGIIVSFRRRWSSASELLLGIGWLVLAVMTPFYHPYARLWLPLHALGWVFLAGLFRWFRSSFEVKGRVSPWRLRRSGSDPLAWFAMICLVGASIQAISPGSPWKRVFPRVLAPRDSLRHACGVIAGRLPREVKGLRAYARPAVAFYLGGRIRVTRQADLEHVFGPVDPSSWALVDSALLRQDVHPGEQVSRWQGAWEWVDTTPALLDIPTLLDIDPGSAREGRWDRWATLSLLRPRAAGDHR